MYISTDDSIAGTQVSTNPNWPTVTMFSTLLTPNVTNYLHIAVRDVGVIGTLIGSFSLDDTGFEFSNGTQSLVTNTTDWQLSRTGFGSNYTAPASQGPLGQAPWNLNNANLAGAEHIWDPNDCTFCTVYFSTAIRPTGAVAVPEPATLALMGFALAGLGYSRRKIA